MDLSQYHPQWRSRLRVQVLIEQNYKCRLCGYEDSTRLGKNGKRIALQVHHLDWDKSNNSLSNLIALCPTCHKRFHTKIKTWTENL